MARDYLLSAADSAGHTPRAPERTALRALRTRHDVQYREYPTVQALQAAMRGRSWRLEGWAACPVPGIVCTICGAPVHPKSDSVRSARPTCSDECTLALWAQDIDA